MGRIGTTELLLILMVVTLLFGVGRISKIGGEMGAAIRAFREGLQGTDKPEEKSKPEEKV